MSHAITLQAFVAADLNRKDRNAMHSVRLSVVTAALDAALRGNKTQYMQAVPAAAGKTQLAKAYRAAFEAVPAPDKFAYSGKLSAEVAAQIAAEADKLAEVWSAAFVSVFPLSVAEKSEEDKAKAKEEREAKAKAEAIKLAQEMGYVKPQELSAAALADQIVALVQSGQLSGENLAHVAQAVNAAVAADDAARKLIRQARKGQPAGTTA